MLWFGVLLVTPMLPTIALSKPEDARPGASLAGQLLVATPDMSDPRFRHTVILMVRHTKDGALGIAINRRRVASASCCARARQQGQRGGVRLFAGGPVQPDAASS
jgi:putative transcriptional regulator